MTSTSCPLCGSGVHLLLEDVSGYQQPDRFAIMRCPNCDTHYGTPSIVPDGLYEAIYREAPRLSGYDRYFAYAARVEASTAPLEILAASEDMYWFVASYLNERVDRAQARILEIGSGLGYLTYSASKAGYNIRGMDISGEAVRRATERYGDLFFQADLFDYSERMSGQYDVIIMTEVIEHVADPVSFIAATAKLLRTGGSLLITTPNKSAAAPNAVWDSDPPPVHLWWFSEPSIRQMAIATGLTVEFWDFTRFNQKRIGGLPKAQKSCGWTFEALLDQDGAPIDPVRQSWTQKIVAAMRGIFGESAVAHGRDAVRKRFGTRKALRQRSHLLLTRSTSLAAILTR